VTCTLSTSVTCQPKVEPSKEIGTYFVSPNSKYNHGSGPQAMYKNSNPSIETGLLARNSYANRK